MKQNKQQFTNSIHRLLKHIKIYNKLTHYEADRPITPRPKWPHQNKYQFHKHTIERKREINCYWMKHAILRMNVIE